MINVFDHYPPHAPHGHSSGDDLESFRVLSEANTAETLDSIAYLLAKAKTPPYCTRNRAASPSCTRWRNCHAANFLRMMFGHPAEPYEVSLVASAPTSCSSSTPTIANAARPPCAWSEAASQSACRGLPACAPLGAAPRRPTGRHRNAREHRGRRRRLQKIHPDGQGQTVGLPPDGHRVYKNFDPRARTEESL